MDERGWRAADYEEERSEAYPDPRSKLRAIRTLVGMDTFGTKDERTAKRYFREWEPALHLLFRTYGEMHRLPRDNRPWQLYLVANHNGWAERVARTLDARRYGPQWNAWRQAAPAIQSTPFERLIAVLPEVD